MLRTTTLVPMAHLICVAHTRLELADILVAYRLAGVENLMALGGDPPTDPEDGSGELAHASELVELAHAIGGFSVGVAAQPAGHPLSADRASDRDHLAAKLAQADFAISQFFFEAQEYAGLVADLAARGVDKPVLPGIMPVTSLSSVPRMATMGAAVPGWMVDRLTRADGRGAGGGPPRRGGHRHRALPTAADGGCPGPALLHTQPVECHPRDLCRPGAALGLTGHRRNWRREHGGRDRRR